VPIDTLHKAGQSLLHTPPLSLRVKLMLWTVTIFLIVQASLALVLQLYQSTSINSTFNDRLEMRAERVAAAITASKAPITDQLLGKLFYDNQSSIPFDEVVSVLFNERGERIAITTKLSEGIPEQILSRVAPATDTEFLTTHSDVLGPPGAPPVAVRAIIKTILSNSGEPLKLVIIRNDELASNMLVQLLSLVFVTIGIGVFATAIASYVIAGIAVRPIHAMTDAIRRISPESIGTQVDLPRASSEMTELQSELELARQRIHYAFQSQERFMSNVSHELKTPLAVMLAEAQLVKLDPARPELRSFVHSVSEEAIRLGQMVDSFLLLTRARHGKREIPNVERCLVRDVLLDSYEACRPMAAQLGVRLEVLLPEGDDVDAGVGGNCDLLRTVFNNLTRNALRFTPRGALVSMLATVQGNHIHATVRDQGKGIAPELLPKIFDRFAQAKEEEQRGRGHGLGLEIALGIVELHGGSIEVRNLPDQGAEFTVILPLHDNACPVRI